MKAIILAAGMGKRLGKYTEGLPKGMLVFNGKSLIERQVEILRKSGIDDITIVTGYKSEKIKIPGIKYYHNPDFENTNMVSTLFCAEKEMSDDLLVCYSDIIYEQKVINSVINSFCDIGVVVDKNYLDYWKNRLNEWQEDMETLQINSSGKIYELGAKTKDLKKAKVRYVGLIKFSKRGLENLREVYYKNKLEYWDKECNWFNSPNFKKAYMTDILQALIDKGCDVFPIVIDRGWMEFDTEEDYEKALDWLRKGTINRYISMDEFLMEKSSFSKELFEMKRIAKIAGEAILKLYAMESKSNNVELKFDSTEIIQADVKSNEIIVNELKRVFTYKVISEEGPRDLFTNELFWVIDPLDGTTDFIKKQNDFCIMIALMKDGKPHIGLVYMPLTNKLYFAEHGQGAFLEHNEKIKKISVSSRIQIDDCRFILSRNHYSEKERAFATFLNIKNIVQKGSIGIKLCEIAEGNADIYYNFDGLNKWDIAAPQIILEEAGGTIFDLKKGSLNYLTNDFRFKDGIIAMNCKNTYFFDKLKLFINLI